MNSVSRHKDVFKSIALIALVYCLASLAYSLNAQQTQVYKPSISRILFILDGSGSMKQKWHERTKYEAAKNLLFKIIDSVERKNPNVEFAVRVFGYQYPRDQKNCTDSRLLIPFAKNNADKINAALGKLNPQGMSPIAYSIAAGAKDFPDDPKSLNSIVLITDGEENCDGDPCASSKELVAKKISLKPFIVGLSVDPTRYDKFNCMGTFYDAKDEASFYNTVGVIIKQTLNTTTAQVNLLNQNGLPTITNMPFTLYDHYSGKMLYNFIHTLNDKGNPDTLYLDPVGVYDLELHTYPSIRKENIELTPGKHNIIAVDVPAGDLKADCYSAIDNTVQVVVRPPDNPRGILNVQDINETETYLTATYRLEILTTPEIVMDTGVVPLFDNKLKIPNAGTVYVNTTGSYLASIYRYKGEMLELVNRFELAARSESKVLQPGHYFIVYKPKNNYDSESTKTQKFVIEEGKTVMVTL